MDAHLRLETERASPVCLGEERRTAGYGQTDAVDPGDSGCGAYQRQSAAGVQELEPFRELRQAEVGPPDRRCRSLCRRRLRGERSARPPSPRRPSPPARSFWRRQRGPSRASRSSPSAPSAEPRPRRRDSQGLPVHRPPAGSLMRTSTLAVPEPRSSPSATLRDRKAASRANTRWGRACRRSCGTLRGRDRG
jgi:hypothetical protein